MAYDLLVFDLDGTLSDPLLGIARSINHALAACGYAEREHADLGTYVGPPIDQTFASLTGLRDGDRLRLLVTRFRERYSTVGYAENEIYAGVRETLEALSAAEAPMAVCTAKRRDLAEKVLDRFAIRHHFRFVHGGDVGIEKWQQLATLRAAGRLPPRSLMIGDRMYDMVAARSVGIESGAVTWGYGSREELQKEQPDRWFHAPQDWLQLLAADAARE